MIRSFNDSEAVKNFALQRSRKLTSNIQQVALRKLRMLNNARTLQDLRNSSANRLEKLSGDRSDQYSIRINDKWRICFEWQDNDIHQVEITDYH